MGIKFKKCTALIIGMLTAFSASADMLKKNDFKADAASKVIAFPGAVGGGSYATGGRGGEVVHVTNLNDSGTGSFRDAVSQSNRIVVFDVSGTIELSSNILVSSNVTIAGQTAPGGSGITLKNYKLGMSGDNIICRYLSSRPGPYKSTSSGNDAWGGAKGSSSIIDHCSMSWTTDEQWGLYSNNEYYTVQYSIIGPADSWGGHSKGIHGFGLMMGKGYSTFDHNLIIHNVSRNFRGKVVGTATADFTNNVIYNWAYETAYGTIGHLNYVGNTLKMGNGTTGGYRYVNVDSTTSPENFKIFLKNNRMLYKDDSVYSSITDNNWAGINYKSGLGKDESNTRSDSAFATTVNGINVSTALTAESAEASYGHVISYAGNGISPTLRTAVDQQAANEAKTGTGNLSGTATYDDADSTQKETLDKYKIQCGTTYVYPSAVTKKTIVDTDNDGMPDDWEIARGLNPNDPSDTKGDYCGQGYTNIEYYINDLTVDSFPEGVVTPSPEITSTKKGAVIDTAHKYKIKNVNSGLFLEVADGKAANGINVQQGNSSANGWTFKDAGDGYYYLCSEVGDSKTYMLDLDSGKTANGTNIGIYSNTNSDAQLFKFVSNGDGTYTITTKSTEDTSCIGITAGSKEDGANVVQWACDGSDNQKWVLEIKVDALNGTLIQNLIVKDIDNYKNWQIANNLQKGNLVFGDRDVTYESLPDALLGAEAIITACDSKNSSVDLASFIAGEDMTVYIAMDNRVTSIPAWLTGWTKTALTAENNKAVVFDLYSKDVKKGDTILLGTNGQSSGCVGYTVLAVKKNSGTYPVGDINLDGETSSADLVLLQKYLLCIEPLTAQQAQIADLDEDGQLDVFDLIALKNLLSSK